MSDLLQHLEKVPQFLAVARARSIKAAAEQLRIAQPALSRSMRILEDALDTTLLIRSRFGVSLTADGEALQTFGNQLVAQTKHLTDRISDKELAGHVTIGTHEILVSGVLAPVIRKMIQQKSEVRISLHTDVSTSNIIKGLVDFSWDLALIPEAKQTHGSLASTKAYEDSLGFFASKDFFKQQGMTDKVSKGKLTEMPLAYFPRLIAGKQITIDAELERLNLSVNAEHEVSSIESAIVLATTGLAYTILPRRATTPLVQRGVLKEFSVRGVPNRLGAHRVMLYFRETDQLDRRVQFAVQAITAG